MNTQYLVATPWRTIYMWEQQKLRGILGYQPAGILCILKVSTGPMEENVSMLKMYVPNP